MGGMYISQTGCTILQVDAMQWRLLRLWIKSTTPKKAGAQIVLKKSKFEIKSEAENAHLEVWAPSQWRFQPAAATFNLGVEQILAN